MKRVVTITKNEKATLDTLINCLYAEAGFSDVDVKDLANSLGWSMAKVKGEIGSLVKKGIVYVDTDFNVISLTLRAYGLHPSWKDDFDLKTMTDLIEVEVN